MLQWPPLCFHFGILFKNSGDDDAILWSTVETHTFSPTPPCNHSLFVG